MNNEPGWKYSNKKRMPVKKAAVIMFGLFLAIATLLLAIVFGAIQFIKWAIEF